jgi:hypothetical protein
MEDLFIALFRRGAERSFERQAEALQSPQPLWSFWELIHDQSSTALTMEFIALANHRKGIRSEIAASSNRFRRMQIGALSSVLEGYGIDPNEWPPASIILMLSGISRFLLMEGSFDLEIGHSETVELVVRHIRGLEGPRRRDTED